MKYNKENMRTAKEILEAGRCVEVNKAKLLTSSDVTIDGQTFNIVPESCTPKEGEVILYWVGLHPRQYIRGILFGGLVSLSPESIYAAAGVLVDPPYQNNGTTYYMSNEQDITHGFRKIIK